MAAYTLPPAAAYYQLAFDRYLLVEVVCFPKVLGLAVTLETGIILIHSQQQSRDGHVAMDTEEILVRVTEG